MTTAEENERLYRRVTEEVWNRHDYDVVDELVADDYVLHDSSMPDGTPWPRGPEGYRQMAEGSEGMIDGPVEIDQLVATDEFVAARFTVRGTYGGGIPGVDPTDDEVTVTGMEMVRFADGKMAESWQEFNMFGLLAQLRALPEEVAAAMAAPAEAED